MSYSDSRLPNMLSGRLLEPPRYAPVRPRQAPDPGARSSLINQGPLDFQVGVLEEALLYTAEYNRTISHVAETPTRGFPH